jgi:hypothetical protein
MFAPAPRTTKMILAVMKLDGKNHVVLYVPPPKPQANLPKCQPLPPKLPAFLDVQEPSARNRARKQRFRSKARGADKEVVRSRGIARGRQRDARARMF